MRLILGEDRPNHQQDAASTTIQFVGTVRVVFSEPRSFAQNQEINLLTFSTHPFFLRHHLASCSERLSEFDPQHKSVTLILVDRVSLRKPDSFISLGTSFLKPGVNLSCASYHFSILPLVIDREVP